MEHGNKGRNKDLFLGLDIGTTNSKAVVVNSLGEPVGQEECRHGVETPFPGWVEHDPEKIWWDETVSLIRGLAVNSGISPNRIRAVAVSGLGAAMVPLGKSGNPLRKAVLYGIDTRAYRETAEMEKALGKERVIEISGQPLSSQSMGPKMLWLKKKEPGIYGKTEALLGTNGYVVWRLTGEKRMDTGTAHFYGPLFDIKKNCWNWEICGQFGLDYRKLPELIEPHEEAGRVTKEAAEITGLPAGIPVIAGTTDTFAEAVGAGAINRGDVFLVYGSTMSLVVNMENPATDRTLWTNRHYLPGVYTLIGAMATSGNLINWFTELIQGSSPAEGEGESIRRLNEGAVKLPPGSEGLMALPYFSGERTPIDDPAARGVIAGLTLGHTQYHLYRALLEGISYGFNHHLEILRDRGVKLGRIISAGGGVRNDLWTRIISDVSGLTQYCVVPGVPAASLGDAYMAGFGAGAFNLGDIQRLTAALEKREIVPDTENHALYKRIFPLYRDLYDKTKEIVHTLQILGSGNPVEVE